MCVYMCVANELLWQILLILTTLCTFTWFIYSENMSRVRTYMNTASVDHHWGLFVYSFSFIFKQIEQGIKTGEATAPWMTIKRTA